MSMGGYAVPAYPDGAWEPAPEGTNVNEIWKLCGPTVERHTSMNFPLWKIFCAVYYEGLMHGMQTTLRLQDEGRLSARQPVARDAL